MNPGLPPPPGPPHDPRSLLLNGRIGFRAIAPAPTEVPAVIDADSCAIRLPCTPSSIRDLAEASGSLGGLRPPSNVALGPEGSIYLLDRPAVELKRFDECTCSFRRVPCFGGEGGGARQLRSPGGIAIACGNLYVCDTGMEHASAADACGDQAALDALIREENHRISVFSLKGFALRGHLRPPPKQRPWRPVSVAVDSLGRVWVGDATGRVHRFSPTGVWEQAWAMVPAPAHLAVDCRDRVYLIAPGGVPSVRVLDWTGAVIPNPLTEPEDVRRAFPHLPFSVDTEGRLSLEPVCDPRAVKKLGSNTELIFDLDGNPIELTVMAAPPLYQGAATYRCGALDSRIAQCVWHRVMLFGSLPPGTRVRVRAFAADEELDGAALNVLAAWQDCATAETFDAGVRWDGLVRAEPGRYLWLEIALEGNGTATPMIGAIVVEFPRVSLRRFLPSVFGMDPVSADFTDRFLALFDTPLRQIERQIDQMARLFDPASTPASVTDPRQQDFLSWLAAWIGITLDRNWDEATRRRFVKRAGALFDRRGTVRGVREQLLLLLDFDRHQPCVVETRACGRCGSAPANCASGPQPPEPENPPLVLEHFRLRRWLRVGRARLGDEAVVWSEQIVGRTHLGSRGPLGGTRLDTSPDPERDPFLVHANQFSVFVPARFRDDDRTRKSLENLVRTEAPADTRGYLHFVEPRFRIGIQAMLGFDAVVGALPHGVRLGATPIGGASILTAPPHMESGPGIAVGREGRLGTTTRLA